MHTTSSITVFNLITNFEVFVEVSDLERERVEGLTVIMSTMNPMNVNELYDTLFMCMAHA